MFPKSSTMKMETEGSCESLLRSISVHYISADHGPHVNWHFLTVCMRVFAIELRPTLIYISLVNNLFASKRASWRTAVIFLQYCFFLLTAESDDHDPRLLFIWDIFSACLQFYLWSSEPTNPFVVYITQNLKYLWMQQALANIPRVPWIMLNCSNLLCNSSKFEIHRRRHHHLFFFFFFFFFFTLWYRKSSLFRLYIFISPLPGSSSLGVPLFYIVDSISVFLH
jgi:hypothetical protein